MDGWEPCNLDGHVVSNATLSEQRVGQSKELRFTVIRCLEAEPSPDPGLWGYLHHAFVLPEVFIPFEEESVVEAVRSTHSDSTWPLL